ncbi:plasmid partitioning protein RepA [Pseudovibrio ascidiaceicola]|uniref:plasmid partitioning protein RepA n=1 Tax=Pseudovibrio TaxID=258255 RepID=UPI0007AE6962|nr:MULTISPECIES: plasmid partitioning protein RepA [Pseudovibrio]KZL13204.1 Sporulation initiation inhibitor protein Soj [Pseudovibrio sp. Ad26]
MEYGNNTLLREETPSEKISRYSQLLSGQLHRLRQELYPPEAHKLLRSFSSVDVARLIGVSESTIRQLDLDGEGPTPTRLANGRRSYTLQQINAIREVLAARKKGDEAVNILPHRRDGEKLQVIACANFKGGSAKTTTSTHLAHYLALRGYRVLAIDLDPQASLSAMFGVQPEFDVEPNCTLFGALRYDEGRRTLGDVIRPTYFDNLDLVPANLELAEFEHIVPTAIASGASTGENIFFRRIRNVLSEVDDRYDVVVIDCPPQLGFLTLGALFASTGLLITLHPQMLDLASCNQFLGMSSDLMAVIENNGGEMNLDWMRFLVTRHNPNDSPQTRVVGLLRALFGEDVLTSPALESTAVANAGLEKKSLYELEPGAIGRETLKRALESMDSVNREIEDLLRSSWGRTL